jgi:hypothetical protein
VTKERPIIFSAPMVRAILAGKKTQTRRALRHQIEAPATLRMSGPRQCEIVNEHGVRIPGFACPYGQPGDRLWVRETWQGPLFDHEQWDDYHANNGRFETPKHCVYAADGGPAPEFVNEDDEIVQRWRPSIHMPRWASRITLEIVDVRIERLHDISGPDCWREGIHEIRNAGDQYGELRGSVVEDFRALWESINGRGSWDDSPWVWALTFKRVEA